MSDTIRAHAQPSPNIRTWLIAQYRARDHGDYQVACQESDLPDDYGDFSVYDGIHSIGGGYSRRLRSTFREYLDRLLRAEVPIFFWKPDSDGSTREYLDGTAARKAAE